MADHHRQARRLSSRWRTATSPLLIAKANVPMKSSRSMKGEVMADAQWLEPSLTGPTDAGMDQGAHGGVENDAMRKSTMRRVLIGRCLRDGYTAWMPMVSAA
jgi:hypothetical protein